MDNEANVDEGTLKFHSSQLHCSLIATPGTEAEDVNRTMGHCRGPSDIDVVMLCVVCTPGHT